MESKFKVGDKCRIVKFGYLCWERKSDCPLNPNFPIVTENKLYRWIDLRPEYVGKEVIITGISGSKDKYSTNLFSWASNLQLELIEN